MSEVVQGILNKRASKRYTYLPQARFDAQNIRQNIQIRDVSNSGLQFFSNSQIQPNAPICVTWDDPTIGALAPFLMIIRKLTHQSSGVFRYCYGSKFFNLRHETQQNLDKLIDFTKHEERATNRALIESIEIENIFVIIEQSRTFMQNLLEGNYLNKQFTRFTREIRDYEKKSFENTDEISQWVQKLTTQNFHVSLLNVAIPFVPKSSPQGFKLYKETVNKIGLVSDIILESKPFEESNLIKESRNRLFYNKLELLQTFVETYESSSSPDATSESVQKIVSEYNQTSPKSKTKNVFRKS